MPTRESFTTNEEVPPNPDAIEKGRDEAFDAISKNQEEYDKQLLTLSSAFLAVALAFIKDVVPLKDAKFLPILYVSFLMLTSCILLVLLSYRSSIKGHFKVLDYWDSLARKENAKFPYKVADRMKSFNRFTGVPFFLGVLLLVVFVILNLNGEANMPNKNMIVQEGAFIKVPVGGENKGAHIKVPTPVPAQPVSQNTGQTPATGGTSSTGSKK